jgi:hypothetical protein
MLLGAFGLLYIYTGLNAFIAWQKILLPNDDEENLIKGRRGSEIVKGKEAIVSNSTSKIAYNRMKWNSEDDKKQSYVLCRTARDGYLDDNFMFDNDNYTTTICFEAIICFVQGGSRWLP